MNIGDRVGAILSEKDKTVEFLGYGTYVGDKVPDKAVGPIAEMLRAIGQANPCIELDSGKVVYGCECWWGPEDDIKKEVAIKEKAGFEIVTIDIDDIRLEFMPKAQA